MSILSSRAIADALREHGNRGSQGTGAHLARQVKRRVIGVPSAGQAQQSLAADLSAPRPRSGLAYDHPGRIQPGLQTKAPASAGSGPLTDADLVWLQRLPSDPTAMTNDEARVLLAMTERKDLPPDQVRLLDSIAGPVREHHDLAAAQIGLANATPPPLPLPHSALPALAEAIAHEVPVLTADEAMSRAYDMVDRINQRRTAEHAAGLSKARAAVDEVLQRRAARALPAGRVVDLGADGTSRP